MARVTAVSVGLIGPGNIGSALLSQIQKQAAALCGSALHANINVVGIANSTKMLISPGGLDLLNWRNNLADQVGEK